MNDEGPAGYLSSFVIRPSSSTRYSRLVKRKVVFGEIGVGDFVDALDCTLQPVGWKGQSAIYNL
jgi:hypothetical protein